ncbi:hypothetical protein [Celerinatantimonas sp. YJH-8]|uniref:hypothetical protein n=1 Tax=Celerinatantimonas sp. YJH-8 TaxID=3228714 RepID=UPI0038C6E17A
MNVNGVDGIRYPVNQSKRSPSVAEDQPQSEPEAKPFRIQAVADDSVLNSVSYDQTPSSGRGAVAAYQSVSMLAQRDAVNQIFGVDVYA